MCKDKDWNKDPRWQEIKRQIRDEIQNNYHQYKDMGQDLINTEAAAQLLNVSAKTIGNWAKDGKLEKRNIGRKVYYSKKQIISIIRE